MADTIRIAIIGVGKIARDQHVPALATNDRFKFVATADRQGGLDAVAAFADLNVLLADGPRFDAVAICTPPQIRTDLARRAIAAGKHVLLEKPPTATLAEIADLTGRAAAAGVTLFAAWHSRFAPMVAAAHAWLAGRTVVGGRIDWREDVRRWHPGQAWLWAPGGLGVFDPGINAFSILTALLPAPPIVAAARLAVPANAHTPIAAQLTLLAGEAVIGVDLDFLQTGPQTWDLMLDTACGHRLRLSDGGALLAIDDGPDQRLPSREYAGVYDRFASLIAARESDADTAPLRLIADALLVAETERVAPFVDSDTHHHVA